MSLAKGAAPIILMSLLGPDGTPFGVGNESSQGVFFRQGSVGALVYPLARVLWEP